MQPHPAFLVGMLVAGASFALFLFLMFSSGGVAKSDQFRVIGELLSGKQGPTKRILTILALIGVLFGSCTLFSGISANDAARAGRCAAYCKVQGHARGVIGPPRATAAPGAAPAPAGSAGSSAQPAARQPPRPACHCEGGPGEPTEMPADDVPGG